MIVVSPLSKVADAVKAHAPGSAISIMDHGARPPCIDGVPAERHLVLNLKAHVSPASEQTGARETIERLLAFIKTWAASDNGSATGSGPLLIHCNHGLNRSPAAAFVVQCALNPDADEIELAAALRAAAQCADPCAFMVSQADELLERDGRMIEAITVIPFARCAAEGDIFTLPSRV